MYNDDVRAMGYPAEVVAMREAIRAADDKPEVMVRSAADKFDAGGRLTDEDTRTHVRGLVDALAEWTRRLGGAS